MSAEDFEAALNALDDNASCKCLHELMSKGRIAESSALPAVAEAFLDVFCDSSRSILRRRWTGLVFATMIGSSLAVVQRLGRSIGKLARVGAAILGPTEVEETRIVAALIIRSGISMGIKYANFWPTDKIVGTDVLFPKATNARWMTQFQAYMDALDGLAMLKHEIQAVILYPVALIASDGYKWAPADENVPILLIQGEIITIIMPDSALRDIEAMDISISQIQSASCRPANLHDSQGRQTKTVPWTVVLKFVPDSLSYTVNCSGHSASDLTITMEHKKDAEDCMNFINGIIFPRRDSSNNTAGSSSAKENTTESEMANNGAAVISRGGMIDFSTSPGNDPENKKSVQNSQRTRRVLTDLAEPVDDAFTNEPVKEQSRVDGVQDGSARRKTGALPVVKKPSRLRDVVSSSAAAHNGLEFSDNESRVPLSQKGVVASQNSAKASITPKQAALKPKQRSGETVNTEDDEDPLALKPQLTRRANLGPKPSRLPKVSKWNDQQATNTRRSQPDVFNIPQEDEQITRRGTKRRRKRSINYKDDDTSEEDSSGSDYIEKKKRRKKDPSPRARSDKCVAGKGTASSPGQGVVSNRIARQSKASTQPLQTHKGTLMSNLQHKANPDRSHDPKPLKARRSNATPEQEFSVTVVEPENIESSDLAPKPGNRILEKLNDVENDAEPNTTLDQVPEDPSGTLSRKRPSPSSLPPSTPRSKRAKHNHGSLLTVAPIRILEDPSSPCGRHMSSSRPNESMQAPPKPVIDDVIRVVPPDERRQNKDSGRQPDKRQTPSHQLDKRSHSGASTNVEILSSNSKPTPASPRAESAAISGHADRHRVNMEKELGEYKIEKSDPFRSNKQKVNEFTRRLTADRATSQKPDQKKGGSYEAPIELGDTSSSASSEGLPTVHAPKLRSDLNKASQSFGMPQIRSPKHVKRPRSRTVEPPNTAEPKTTHGRWSRAVQDAMRLDDQEVTAANNMEMEGDTLLGLDEAHLPEPNALSDNLRSSPPPLEISPSSHSSTSVELEPKTDPPVPTSAVEEMEWEASLQPYQRDLQVQLLRVSNRVLRHIVDKESAVADIAETYAKDGQHTLQMLRDNHKQEFDSMHKDVQDKKVKVTKASEKLLSKLSKEREEILKVESSSHQ